LGLRKEYYLSPDFIIKTPLFVKERKKRKKKSVKRVVYFKGEKCLVEELDCDF